MASKPENILLDSEYDFDVTVEYKGEKFAGKLSLKKEAAHLSVYGEKSDGPEQQLPWDNISRVECHNFNSTISLFNLKFTSGSSRVIDHIPPRAFFESTYEVGFVLFSKTRPRRHDCFYGIEVHSNTISKWIGNTTKQEEIISLYHAKELFNQKRNEHLLEFRCNVPEIGVIGASYNASIFHNSPEFKAGVTFPPSLFFLFAEQLSAEDAFKKASEIISFFKFVTGGNVEISKIEFLLDDARFSENATLYLPRNNEIRQGQLILFPLGTNLRFDSLGLPEFPLIAISNFFSQDYRKLSLFKRYLKYREMNSEEERFLGLFRILETLSYKEGKYLDEAILRDVIKRAEPYLTQKFGDKKSVTGFIKRIPRWNSSKYNAEKCISDLLKDLPEIASKKWKFSTKDVGQICKLRNDITHANDYDVSTATISAYAKFVEVLVVYSLLIQIGVSKQSAAEVLHRVAGQHEIFQFG